MIGMSINLQDLSDHAHKHEVNCAVCDHYEHKPVQADVYDLAREIHFRNARKENDHSVNDSTCPFDDCDVEGGHAHIKHNHKHIDHSNMDKDKNQTISGFKPLEELITTSNLPNPMKEFLMNFSYLSSSITGFNIFDHLKLPRPITSLASLGLMHGLNRGKEKLGRLALAMLTSLSSSLAQKFGLSRRLIRLVATSALAVFERFGNGHVHSHDHDIESHSYAGWNPGISSEFKTIAKNITDLNKWKELWPGLVSIEAKVNLISLPINKFFEFLLHRFRLENSLPVKLLSPFMQAGAISSGFMALDKILKSLSKVFGEYGSGFASAIGAACGCCGSALCSTAAMDSALGIRS